jgi:alkylation response protein AidB-like acyl-CoA dehydrogenase
MMATEPTTPLTSAHRALRSRVRKLAEESIAPDAASVDRDGRFPFGAYKALVESGLLATHIPREFGGQGADAATSCVIVEEVARVCASSSLIPNVTRLGTLPLIVAGDRRLNERYLRPVVTDGAMFAFALSEPDAGSDPRSLTTTAERDGDSYVLNGTKRWITNAGFATYYYVVALTGDRRFSGFVVHGDDPGVAIGPPDDKLGMRGSPTCSLTLRDVQVPADRLVGAAGDGLRLALAALDHSRVTIAAQAVGIAQGAIDHATAYVRERRQFGRPIADFDGVRFMVADMTMKVAAARELTYAAASRLDSGASELRFYSAAAKCFASDVAMAATTDAVQLLGGSGYTREYAVERMMRDAKLTQIYEGTNQIQRLILAQAQLGRPTGDGIQAEFGAGGWQ